MAGNLFPKAYARGIAGRQVFMGPFGNWLNSPGGWAAVIRGKARREHASFRRGLLGKSGADGYGGLLPPAERERHPTRTRPWPLVREEILPCPATTSRSPTTDLARHDRNALNDRAR
jgi:hypothetical protein